MNKAIETGRDASMRCPVSFSHCEPDHPWTPASSQNSALTPTHVADPGKFLPWPPSPGPFTQPALVFSSWSQAGRSSPVQSRLWIGPLHPSSFGLNASLGWDWVWGGLCGRGCIHVHVCSWLFLSPVPPPWAHLLRSSVTWAPLSFLSPTTSLLLHSPTLLTNSNLSCLKK